MAMCKNNKGFTFVEIITGTVLITIAVAAVYGAFISAVQLAGFFRHDVMSVIGEKG